MSRGAEREAVPGCSPAVNLQTTSSLPTAKWDEVPEQLLLGSFSPLKSAGVRNSGGRWREREASEDLRRPRKAPQRPSTGRRDGEAQRVSITLHKALPGKLPAFIFGSGVMKQHTLSGFLQQCIRSRLWRPPVCSQGIGRAGSF